MEGDFGARDGAALGVGEVAGELEGLGGEGGGEGEEADEFRERHNRSTSSSVNRMWVLLAFVDCLVPAVDVPADSQTYGGSDGGAYGGDGGFVSLTFICQAGSEGGSSG